MPQDATCPKCQHSFPVTEARHPYTVACPRCEADITVEFKKPAAPPEAGQPPYDLLVKAGALPGTTTAAPPTRRKKDDDDDEPKRKGGSAMVVLLSGGLGLLFVLGGLGVTGWFLFTQIDLESTSHRPGTSNPRPNSNPKGINTVTPGPRVNPGFNPNPNPNPDPFNPPPKPKVRELFNLAPVPGKLDPIREPADLLPNATKTILFNGPVDEAAVGGGGRYIVFHSSTQARLAVFDVSTAELVNSKPVDAERVMLTAGANKIATLSKKRIRVYSLPSLADEREFDSPMQFDPVSITLGAGTNGPLLVADPFGKLVLMDLATGTEIEGSLRDVNNINARHATASHDGTKFLVGGDHRRDRCKVVDENGGKWRMRDPAVEAGYIGANGQYLYGRNAIKAVGGGSPVASKPVGATEHCWYVPAVTTTGNYFTRVSEVKFGMRPEKNVIKLTFHKDNNVDRQVAPEMLNVPEIEGIVSQFFGAAEEPLNRHLFLIPEAKTLVILSRDRTKLLVRKLPI